ncbi:MAG: RNA polymerase factor sigma-54 [Simkaniaceae bacterium]
MGHNFHLSQNLKQDQRLIMSQGMRQAFDVLQMPVLELSAWLEKEIEQNPLLEISKPSCREISYGEMAREHVPSRHEYLMGEIRAHFFDKKEQQIAEYIAGSLDEKGFLSLSLEELCRALEVKEEEALKVLHVFQRMDPVGLGTPGAQQALLVQLERKGLKQSVIYSIVDQHYSDLLHKRLKKILKTFHLTPEALKELVKTQLRPLNPFPGHSLIDIYNPPITADILIEKVEERWKVRVNEKDLPSFEIREEYASQDTLTQEERDYFRRHRAAGKWLMRILDQRKETLEKVMAYILKKQIDFFEGVIQEPHPMTMQEIALALEKSESTITRAIGDKYLACPQGFLRLRSLFTQALQTEEGTISNKRAKDLLGKMIAQEKTPLSDEALSQLLKTQGIPCARRTVAKYRKQLKILSASKRVFKNSFQH